ncbi:MAG: hypothetical protein GC181_03755 [Bacteroidetes bacterium]|nr:hypothetical protein [Bacteroidota bacterium]
MKNPFQIGDIKYYKIQVGESDTARFETGLVHPFYATFALGRDAEWAGRLFVLEMKEADEEGIGTYLNIQHLSPAISGDEVMFESKLIKVEKNSVECSFKAKVGERIIAEGSTGQKILKRERLEKLMESLNG